MLNYEIKGHLQPSVMSVDINYHDQAACIPNWIFDVYTYKHDKILFAFVFYMV